jgi:hypothetical protein
MSMTAQDISLLRLHNQQITTTPSRTPAEIADYMGALQGQDYYNALWALGIRTGQTEAEILQSLEDRTVIRTWPQRGTLHFVAAQNARWQVELSAARLLKGAVTRHKNLGLDEATFMLSEQILRRALARHTYLTRPQILEALEEAGIASASGRGYHMLWRLAQTGVTYVGPMHAKQQTFGLLDELVPKPQSLPREESIIALAKRYFMSHGPATLQDFMWWTGLTATDAKFGLTANEHNLESLVVDTKIYWMPKNITATADQNVALLLPGFDEYLLGYKDRSAALPIHHASKVVPGNNGVFFPPIVLRGQVVGTWKRVIKKDHVLLNLSPFEHLSSSDIALLQKPASAYGKFLGLSSKIEIL